MILTVAIGMLDKVKDKGTIATRVNIIPSKENSDIRK